MDDLNILENVLLTAGMFIGFILFGLLPICALLYLVYFLLTLPMRRRERARLFLHLLEMGLNEGRSAAAAIAEAAWTRDHSLGARFHSLTDYLRQGMTLSQALEHVPCLLPPRMMAMLKTAEGIGDVRKVLPACRHLLRDGVSQVRGALNYLVLLAFVITPFSIAIPILLRIKVIPSYEQVFQGLFEGSRLPAFTRLIFASSSSFTIVQIIILLILWLALIFYVGGPRLRQWASDLIGGRQWISPWSWRRLQRDFSAMLAVLLDSGVPEAEAVRMAAESTTTPVMNRRAQEVCRKLQRGIRLPEALKEIDKSGELPWRITNALRHGKGFLQALSGWHEALDARAFQLEQSAAQITTSGLVLLNGAIVACIVIAVFLALINLLNEAALW
jgi:type II secretory pathway component PulF